MAIGLVFFLSFFFPLFFSLSPSSSHCHSPILSPPSFPYCRSFVILHLFFFSHESIYIKNAEEKNVIDNLFLSSPDFRYFSPYVLNECLLVSTPRGLSLTHAPLNPHTPIPLGYMNPSPKLPNPTRTRPPSPLLSRSFLPFSTEAPHHTTPNYTLCFLFCVSVPSQLLLSLPATPFSLL